MYSATNDVLSILTPTLVEIGKILRNSDKLRSNSLPPVAIHRILEFSFECSL